MSTLLEVATPQCAAEVLDDEVVVLNVETGVYFSLRGLANTIWRALAAGRSVESLTAEDSGRERIPDFVAELVRYGLMRPAQRVGEDDVPLAIDTGAEILFEVYEDLQDLILSDPIHDVDEAVGWPAPKPHGG